jgi:ankyrin repeat protein
VAGDIQALLTHALRQGCLPAIRFALAKNADPNFSDGNGMRPLHYIGSASESSIEAVTLLRARGADPNLASATGQSAYEQARTRLSGTRNWPLLDEAFKTP